MIVASLQRIRLAVFILYFCQGILFGSWASRIPDFKTGLSLDDSVWGTVLLMLALGQAIGMSMSGFLVSKFGVKKILFVALFGCVLCLLQISLAESLTNFSLCLILFGIFSNFLNIAVNTQGIATEMLYGKSVMSSFHGGWSLGGFVGVLVGLLMISCKLAPFWQYAVTGVFIFAIVFSNFKYLPKAIKKQDLTNDVKSKSLIKPEKFLYALGLVAFCGMFIEGTMFDWSGIYFKDVVRVQPSLVPLGFAGFMAMMAAGRFVSDACANKWGRAAVVKICALFSLSGIAIAVLFPYLATATMGFMLIGLGVSSIVPMIYSIAGQRSKLAPSLALTVVSSISFLGFLIGPPIIGYISSATNLRFSFLVAALFAIIILMITLCLNIFKNK